MYSSLEGIMQANGQSMPWPGDIDARAKPRYRLPGFEAVRQLN